MKCNKKLIAIAVAISLMLSGSAWAGDIDDIREYIRSQYYREVDSSVLDRGTIDEILAGLDDPHTSYMTEEEYTSFLNSIDGRFYGVGFHFEMVDRGVLITSIIPNSPAEHSGLLEGDIIISADGKSMAGISSEEAVSVLRGPEGSRVNLLILRESEELEFMVTRGEIKVESVVDDGNGYISISSFGAETGGLFGKAIGNQNSNGIILDLRNNGGGYLSSAIDMLGYLVPGQTAVTVRNKTSSDAYTAPQKDSATEKPLILLQNEYSASASELVAASLKDHDRALLIGSNSYGKGTVQSFFQTSEGGVLKMTIWEFLSPHGNVINKTGVSPDLEISEGNALKSAKLLLSGDADDYMLELDGNSYYVDLETALSGENWGAYRELLLSAGEQNIWSHYYPDYRLVGNLEDVPLDKTYTVKFNGDVAPETINDGTVDLVNVETGEEEALQITVSGSDECKVKPLEPLDDDTKYWLVLNRGIKSPNGKALNYGSIATIDTI